MKSLVLQQMNLFFEFAQFLCSRSLTPRHWVDSFWALSRRSHFYDRPQLILSKKEISVTEIARELNQSHPAVVQVMNVLYTKKLILTRKDNSDHRKRLVKLSKKGKKLAEDLKPLWDTVNKVSEELLHESDPSLLERIAKVETALMQKSTYQRIQEHLNDEKDDYFEIIPFESKYSEDFRKLNENWLSTYLDISEYDKMILSDPINNIIKNNGEIFLMHKEGELIGTYALKKINNQDCELSKFTIKKNARGRKLGKLLLEHAIKRAKALGYNAIVLFTHQNLVEASHLYKKRGFAEIEIHNDITDETGRCSMLLKLNINQ